MSLPLVDFRMRLTPEAAAVLEAAAVSGRDKSEIARDVLHRWAVKEIRASIVLHAELRSKGILRDYEGVQGMQGAAA